MTTKYTANFGLALPDFRQGPWHDQVNTDFTKIDALLFSAMSQANVLPWEHNVDYVPGLSALDITDATVWMCVLAHKSASTGTFAADRAAHPTYWTRLLTGFAPRGEWAQNTIYFPYDLAYDSARGIMALCITKHTSTAIGSIITDKAYWAFLLDMSDVGTMTANAVSYSNLASGMPVAHVQAALDYVEAQVKALDAVNVTQGNQITAVQNVNTGQDTRLTNLENKNTYGGAISAPYFMATSGVQCQLGGGAQIGYYMDASNAAIRPPGNGTTYFQSQGGAITYGTIGNGSANFHSALSCGAGFTSGGDTSCHSLYARSGGIYVSGWGGNGNISVIFLNSAQNHYIYHDQNGNVSFSGVPAVHAGNGRLWGSSDFAGIPNSITDGRLPYAGDTGVGYPNQVNVYTDAIAHAMVTGSMLTFNYDFGWTFLAGHRCRYVQGYRNGWFTFPMA